MRNCLGCHIRSWPPDWVPYGLLCSSTREPDATEGMERDSGPRVHVIPWYRLHLVDQTCSRCGLSSWALPRSFYHQTSAGIHPVTDDDHDPSVPSKACLMSFHTTSPSDRLSCYLWTRDLSPGLFLYTRECRSLFSASQTKRSPAHGSRPARGPKSKLSRCVILSEASRMQPCSQGSADHPIWLREDLSCQGSRYIVLGPIGAIHDWNGCLTSRRCVSLVSWNDLQT